MLERSDVLDGKLIIFNSVGGLGNQMFQYAAGRALALQLDLPLKVATDMFQQYQGHQGYELDKVFGLSVAEATPRDLRRQLGHVGSRGLVRRLIARPGLSAIRPRRFLLDTDFSLWSALCNTVSGDGAYLHGYWQSEKYFVQHARQVREDFSFARSLVGENAETARAIQASAAVAIHVRRGDYVSNPHAHALHGLCDISYYRQSVELMRQKVRNPVFFAFSDEPEWMRQNFASFLPDARIVSWNKGADSQFDLQLMSLCSHQIIANSTFSWWAAWLNANPAKMVMAPARWYADGTEAPDLLPATWIKVG